MAPPTPAERSSPLILGPGAADVRRAVGPTAWAVLECLAANADEIAGETVSYASVRRIAAALDLAKDTVARALRRLADADLVVYVPGRSHDGRFAPSHYQLRFPADLFLEFVAALPAIETAPSTRSTRHRRPSNTIQLSLIDPVPNVS